MKTTLTASIVIYNNKPEVVNEAISSFLRSAGHCLLYVIDNSPYPFKDLPNGDPRILYQHNNGRNLGFGAAHNIALKQAIQRGSTYHVVVNPDVYFDDQVIPELTRLLENHPEIGLAMPKVLYPDGRLQYLCKLLPSPTMLLLRRFAKPFSRLIDTRNEIFELQFTGYNKLMDVPFLSGCFMFLRMEAIRKVGLFDESIFLYTEDIDLTRRIHQHYRTVFYPHVQIYHLHEKASYRNLRALLLHAKSAITYFNKWGWFVDPERKRINRSTILKLTQ